MLHYFNPGLIISPMFELPNPTFRILKLLLDLSSSESISCFYSNENIWLKYSVKTPGESIDFILS